MHPDSAPDHASDNAPDNAPNTPIDNAAASANSSDVTTAVSPAASPPEATRRRWLRVPGWARPLTALLRRRSVQLLLLGPVVPVAAMLWMVYGPIPQLTIPDDACEPNDRRTADGQYLELAEELLDRMGKGPRENYWVRLATPELTEDRKPSPTPYHALPESLLDESQTQLTFPAPLTGADRQRLQQYLTDNEAWFESVLAPPTSPAQRCGKA